MKAPLVAAGVLLTSLVFVSVAHAASPTRERIQLPPTFPAPRVTAICGFPVVNTVSGWIVITTFFDQSGNVARTVEMSPGFKHTWTNVLNGKSVGPTPQPFRTETAFNADGSMDISISGLLYRMTAPGQGSVAIDSGRTVIHISADGTETLVHQSGPEDAAIPALCSLLSD